MHENSKKSISVLIIAILLFSGVCLISGRADSSFACLRAETHTTQTIWETGRIPVMAPFTTENVGVYDTASMQQIITMGVLFGKNSTDLFGLCCILLLLTQFFSYYLTTVSAATVVFKFSSTAVLRYIHNTDGKK